MTKRLPETMREHEMLIRGLAVDLVCKGYQGVRAHLPEEDWAAPERLYSPDRARSMRPDLEAWRGPNRLLFEVETADTVTSLQARFEVELLAELSRSRPDHFCYLVVPTNCKHLPEILFKRFAIQPGPRFFVLPLAVGDSCRGLDSGL
jgi:hypothetical protein